MVRRKSEANVSASCLAAVEPQQTRFAAFANACILSAGFSSALSGFVTQALSFTFDLQVSLFTLFVGFTICRIALCSPLSPFRTLCFFCSTCFSIFSIVASFSFHRSFLVPIVTIAFSLFFSSLLLFFLFFLFVLFRSLSLSLSLPLSLSILLLQSFRVFSPFDRSPLLTPSPPFCSCSHLVFPFHHSLSEALDLPSKWSTRKDTAVVLVTCSVALSASTELSTFPPT